MSNSVIDWQLELKNTSYPTLSSEQQVSCGISASGKRIECWDRKERNSKAYKDKKFVALDVGGDSFCAIDENSNLLCWKFKEYRPFIKKEGNFVDVEVSPKDEKCVITNEGVVRCWQGDNSHTVCFGEEGKLRGCTIDGKANRVKFKSVMVEDLMKCGILQVGKMSCWKHLDVIGYPTQTESFDSGSLGSGFGCGILDDSTVSCWGWNDYKQASAPDSKFLRISAGKEHVCGLTLERKIDCWGRNNLGQAEPPSSGTYKVISSGSAHSCAITLSNKVECWGKGFGDIPEDILKQR